MNAMLRIEELMTTGVLALKDTDTISRANGLMETASIRHLPVVDERFHVVGMLSNRDLLAALAAPKGRYRRIGEVMTRDVKSVRPETPAYRGAELMLEHKIGALPVVGEDDVMIGIVTETDYLGVAHRALHGKANAALLNA
jgi:CBS domain-containing protein